MLSHRIVGLYQTTPWVTLYPKSPFYYFFPQESANAREYEQGWKLTEIMPINSVGLYTARDDLAIQWSKAELMATLKDFVSLSEETAREKYHLGKDSRDWQVSLAQKDIQTSSVSQSKVQEVSYRPFDIRFTYYTGVSRGLICMPRPEVMHNMLHENNLAICFMRNSREQIVSNFFVAKHIVDKTILSSADNANVAPLYLYSDSRQAGLFDSDPSNGVPGGRHPNLAVTFIEEFAAKLAMTFIPDGKGDLQQTFGPEDIFHYMYAVFHSPAYRERYAEFLKTDFPRLPLTSNADLFRNLCSLGERLVELHLMEKVIKITTRFPESGNNLVEKVGFTYPANEFEKNRVWINKTQYFEGVPQEVWEFCVGGYQVCQKLLKDRKGRTLTFNDIQHYQRVVAALAETITLMEQIDETIEEQGGWPLG